MVRMPFGVGSLHTAGGTAPSSFMDIECVIAPGAGVTFVLTCTKLLTPAMVPLVVAATIVVPTGRGFPTASTILRSTVRVPPVQVGRLMGPESTLTTAVEPENTIVSEPRT